MDRKDEIISAGLEVIRSMTERGLAGVGDDISSILDMEKTAKGDEVREENKEVGEGKTDNKTDKEDKPEVAAAEDGEKESVERLDDLLAELDGYVGLTEVKGEVRALVNLAKVYAMRRQNGLPVADISLHLVFSGNPGTGKTMIARFMARVYRAVGILSKGHLVETDRSGLVAGYVGQTAIKTAEVLERAKGGVLFVDEAYSLTSKNEGDFGFEAVDTILKYMEDHRDDLVVIVAGYSEPMKKFISSNPGLESRFNKYVDFADYTADEMMKIFELYCKKSCYVLTDEAKDALASVLEICASDAGRFGNGRGVRNLFERALTSQANRLASAECPSRDELMRLEASDIEDATK